MDLIQQINQKSLCFMKYNDFFIKKYFFKVDNRLKLCHNSYDRGVEFEKKSYKSFQKELEILLISNISIEYNFSY